MLFRQSAETLDAEHCRPRAEYVPVSRAERVPVSRLRGRHVQDPAAVATQLAGAWQLAASRGTPAAVLCWRGSRLTLPDSGCHCLAAALEVETPLDRTWKRHLLLSKQQLHWMVAQREVVAPGCQLGCALMQRWLLAGG